MDGNGVIYRLLIEQTVTDLETGAVIRESECSFGPYYHIGTARALRNKERNRNTDGPGWRTVVSLQVTEPEWETIE